MPVKIDQYTGHENIQPVQTDSQFEMNMLT